MKLNPEQRLIVYIALLWAYENKEEGVAVMHGKHSNSFGDAIDAIFGSWFNILDFPELFQFCVEAYPNTKRRKQRISLLEKAIEETERKIWG